jgi:PHD/YefM family antitoxin component YafN of YafNO toxin-antitoxin module
VTVTKYGRPSVVILSAAEYERLRKLDRQTLAVTELSDSDIDAIRAARIPKKNRYRSSDLP